MSGRRRCDRPTCSSHLIECGCRHIAHIADPAGRETLRADYVAHASGEENSYEVTRTLLSFDPQPDGIFIYSDGAAARAMRAILDGGICIPKQIKIIGVGNAPYSHLLPVPLSTIDQRSGIAGQHAPKL
jgi:LacI family transcriptional regulator